MKKLLSIGLLMVVAACSAPQTRLVNQYEDTAPPTLGLDYRDFERAAYDAVDSMLVSGAVDNPNGGRYVLAISRVTNDTQQRIDVDQLVKKIRVALLNSGKVVTTTAVSGAGAEDHLVYGARDLRGHKEFDQRGVAREGQLQAPDMSLSGKIIQRNQSLDKRTQQVEYYFQLTLSQINTGLAVWEGETPIVKRGRNDGVTWP